MRELLAHFIGGGWGSEEPREGYEPVQIIRGADFPAVSVGSMTGSPHRYEASKKVPKRVLQPGDIVLEVSGGTKGRPTGRTVFASNRLLERAATPVIPASFCRLLRPDAERVVPAYLYYWLQNLYAQGGTWKYQVQSTGIANFQMKMFLDSEKVRSPPLDEQHRIASVLGAFDDLIETQRTIAQVAEDLWRAVVSSAISEDADRVPLSSLADFVNGRNFTRDANGEGLPVIRTPEVRTGPTESTVYNDVEADETRIAEPGDILFVWSGSLMASRWAWGRGLINQHVFKVIPGEDTPDWLAMFAVEELMDDFLRVAADKATTMGHIKRSDLNSPVATPPRDKWNRLDRVVRPLWDEALSAREHIADLTRTRDELLPLLMSGKVRVDDVEIPKGAA